MENNHKRILLNMAYYTIFGLSVLFSALFVLRVIFSTMPLYIQIIYYVWAAAIVGTLIFDIYCTRNNTMKFITGIILFVLTLLCVIMAIDVFFMQGLSFRTITNLEFTFFVDMSLSFIPIELAVIDYILGERIINFHD